MPNTNECHECHGEDDAFDTLGVVTRQLEGELDDGDGVENQIDRLARLGYFTEPPDDADARPTLVDPMDPAAPLEQRARSYLDANCGSCHRPDGAAASQSALWLDYPSTAPEVRTPATWGECKVPGSAGGATCGLTYDIVPGNADASIFICRIESDIPKVRMPPLARRLTDEAGVELIREWIDAMPANSDCN